MKNAWLVSSLAFTFQIAALSGCEQAPEHSSGTDPATPKEPVVARGLSISKVEANQAVAVTIAENGVFVGTQRAAHLIQNRDTLIRAFWKIADEENWLPREIEAQLILIQEDGSEKTFIQTRLVEGPSYERNLNDSFGWKIPREYITPSLRYKISLFEKEADEAILEIAEEMPHTPEKGALSVGLSKERAEIDIVLVPFDYDDGAACTTEIDVSEGVINELRNYMYMMSPVEKVNIVVHQRVKWQGKLTDSYGPLMKLIELRKQEEAPPHVFYYGVINHCDGGIQEGSQGGFTVGRATAVNPFPTSMAYDMDRIAWGVMQTEVSQSWEDNQTAARSAAYTFVHEIGHTLGRAHVLCSQKEGGTDPKYPQPEDKSHFGAIQTWGYGVLDNSLRNPYVYRDIMSYCPRLWISPYGWNKVYPVLTALTQMRENTTEAASGHSRDAAKITQEGTILWGFIDITGQKQDRWLTLAGNPELVLQTPDNTVTATFYAGDQQVASREGRIEPSPEHDHIYKVIVQAPENIEQVTHVVWQQNNLQRKLKIADVKPLHHYRQFDPHFAVRMPKLASISNL